MLCPTRRAVDATETSEEGVAADVCWFLILHLLREIYARIRTYYVRPNTFGEKEKNSEIRPRDGHVEHVYQFSGSIS